MQENVYAFVCDIIFVIITIIIIIVVFYILSNLSFLVRWFFKQLFCSSSFVLELEIDGVGL